MRTLPFAVPFLGFVVASTAYGCTLDVSGLEAPTSSVGGAASVTSTTSSISTGCEPVAEICDDGLDNDCNGMTDCADPGCAGATGYTCSPVAPAGWTVVTFAASSPPDCPAGFEDPTVVAPPPAAGATCDCACGPATKNPCTQGTLSITVGMSCTALPLTLQVTGACQSLPAKITGHYGSGIAQPLPATPVACAAMASLPAAPPAANGVTCTPIASSAGGCDADAACLPRVTSASLCIQRSGDLECPAGPFTKRQLVGAPGDVTDQRSCGTCSCTSTATTCSNALFTGYDNSGCTKDPASVAVDGTCHSTGALPEFYENTHYKYTATPNTLSCAPSGNPAAVSGVFELDDPITICCQ